jgi:hypothetical protein
MRHLWFRVLGSSGLSSARTAAARGPARIFAAEIDGDVLEARGEPQVRMMPISIAVEDESGRNIRARVEELSTILAFHASVDGREWLPRPQRAWSAEWRRLLAAHYYEACGPLAELLASVERRYAIGEIEVPDEIVIDLGQHLGADAVCRYATTLLRLPVPVVLRGSSSAVTSAALAELSRQVRRVVRVLAKWLLRRGPHHDRQPEVNIDARGQGIVLVQHEFAMMDRLPLGATQDWIEAS